MAKIIIGIVILYYVALLWYFRRKKPEKKIPYEEPQNTHNDSPIIGKSTFRLCQAKPPEAMQSHISKPITDTITFVPPNGEDTPQPMDVEIKSEYNTTEELDLEVEEIACFTGGQSQSARGISFEEMAQAVRVIGEENAPEAEERKAVQTLAVMEQTNLYDTMIAQINGGRQRVSEMLGRYDFVFIAPVAETATEDLKEFDMNNYM